ncbi:MAG: CotH kinase family protein [Candidatus Komeilibacteria bacterium]
MFLSPSQRYRIGRIILWLALGIIIIVVPVVGSFVRLGRVGIYRYYHAEIQLVRKLSNIFFLPVYFLPSQLESYDLKISVNHWYALNHNLPAGYADNLLGEQYKKTEKAVFTATGYEATTTKVRYRGGTDNHWRDAKKSWLIKFPDDDYFDGYQKIALIIPDDRKYFVEEISNFRAKKLGLPAPQTKFVNFFVNGARQGVYWQVEDFNADLLERQGIDGQVNFYTGVDTVDFPARLTDYFDSTDAWSKISQDPSRDATNKSDLQALLDAVNNLSDKDFAATIPQLVDMDSFYRWQILQVLNTSSHATGPNIRMYFDSKLKKFVFFPWDVSLSVTPPALLEYKSNKLTNRILANPEFLQQRNEVLWDYLDNNNNLTDDLAEYDRLDNLTRIDFLKDWLKVDSDWRYLGYIKMYRAELRDKIAFLKNNFKNATASITTGYTPGQLQISLDLGTSGFSSVRLDKLTVNLLDSCVAHLKLVADSNNDGLYDAGDKVVKNMDCSQGSYTIKPDLLILAARDMSDALYMKPKYSSRKVWLVADNSAVWQRIYQPSGTVSPNITAALGNILSVEFSNAFTSKKISSVNLQ